jgi:membrane protease YdiL (CAAX protease family)
MLDPSQTPSGDDARASRGTTAFFAAALGFTWLLQLPALLAQRGILPGPAERFVLPAALGGFGPLLAAVLLSRIEGGGAGVRALFRPLRTWRVGAGWYVVALGGFAMIHVGGRAVFSLLGGGDAGPWLYPPENAGQIAAMLVVPFAEEPGWRGFALPRLQRRHGALKASLLVGVGWALWHTVMFLLQGATPLTFAISMVNVAAGSVVFSWIYNHTRGSLLLAMLAHAGVHLNNPYHALPGHVTPFVVYTVAMCVAAGALVVGDPAAWRAPETVRAG